MPVFSNYAKNYASIIYKCLCATPSFLYGRTPGVEKRFSPAKYFKYKDPYQMVRRNTTGQLKLEFIYEKWMLQYLQKSYTDKCDVSFKFKLRRNSLKTAFIYKIKVNLFTLRQSRFRQSRVKPKQTIPLLSFSIAASFYMTSLKFKLDK